MTTEKRHPYPRTHRLSENLREVIADGVERLKDPRIGFVTVTGVEVTPDLQHATVFFTVMGDEQEKADTVAGLRSAAPYLRREVGSQLRMKRLPELEFREDPAAVAGLRVEEIIRDIHRHEGEQQ